MKVLLIFPPISDPRSPHLAQACLAAKLKSEGHEVHLWDLDLELSLKLLEPDNLLRSLERCKEKMAAIDLKDKKDYADASYWHHLNQVYRSMGDLPNQIGKTLQILRSDAFYDRERFRWARKSINGALNLVSVSQHPHLNYQMDGQVFETVYRADSLSDLKKAVLDDEANLFGHLYDQYVLPRISQLNPQFIGISILNYQQIIPGLTISHRLMQRGWQVFIGGTLFVKFIKEIEQDIQFFDFCRGLIVYEGETALTELLTALERREGVGEVPNLLYPSEKMVKFASPVVVEDLNQLPTPDFDGLPLNAYLAPRIVLPFNLGKGCYWDRCLFCEIPFINNRTKQNFRIKEVSLIVDQLEELSRKYNTPYFQFTDESCHPDVLAAIADKTIERKLNIRYICYARFDLGFSQKLCKHLYQAGCRKILFGLESGSQRILDMVNKGISVDQAEKTLRNCAGAGIRFRVFAMIGLPHETVDEAMETFNFFKRNKDLFISPFNHFEFSPFHLDRHSPFGREPDKHALHSLSGNENPFSLGGWSFETDEGMSIKKMKKVYREITGELYNLLNVRNKYSGWEEYALLSIDRMDFPPPQQ